MAMPPGTPWAEALDCIDRRELKELQKLDNPPQVLKVLAGVFLILEGRRDLVEYADIEIRGASARYPMGWSARSRMKDVSAFARLKQMIDDGQMLEASVLEARQYLTNAVLSVEAVRHCSHAFVGVCRFLHSLVAYYEWKMSAGTEQDTNMSELVRTLSATGLSGACPCKRYQCFTRPLCARACALVLRFPGRRKYRGEETGGAKIGGCGSADT